MPQKILRKAAPMSSTSSRAKMSYNAMSMNESKMSAKRCRKIREKATAKPKTEAELGVYAGSMKYNEIDAASDMMGQLLVNLMDEYKAEECFDSLLDKCEAPAFKIDAQIKSTLVQSSYQTLVAS